jgi:acyl-CoA thioesterase FadM
VGVTSPEVAGYRFVVPVVTTAADVDSQGHLNNAAIARIFNDLRVAYIQAGPGKPWGEYLARERAMVVVRELHVRYDREASLGDELFGAVRVSQRRGKAKIVEERIVLASGESVAEAWVVQLHVRAGEVIPFPDFYWEALAIAEGAPVPVFPDVRPRPGWGPPR